jgi:hypothetical protein
LLRSPQSDHSTLLSPSPRSLLFPSPSVGSWPGWRYGGDGTTITFTLALEQAAAVCTVRLMASHAVDTPELLFRVSIRTGLRLDRLSDTIDFPWAIQRGEARHAEFSLGAEEGGVQVERCRLLEVSIDCGDVPARELLLHRLELSVADTSSVELAPSPIAVPGVFPVPTSSPADAPDGVDAMVVPSTQSSVFKHLGVADGTVERVGTRIQLKLRKECAVDCLELRVSAFKGPMADARLARTIECTLRVHTPRAESPRPPLVFQIPVVRRAIALYFWFPSRVVSVATFETLSSHCDSQLSFSTVFGGFRPMLCARLLAPPPHRTAHTVA